MAEELQWDAEPKTELYDQRANFFALSFEGQETVIEVPGKYEGDFNAAILKRSHTHLALCRRSDSVERCQGDVSFAPLNSPNVGPMKPTFVSAFLLRPFTL